MPEALICKSRNKCGLARRACAGWWSPAGGFRNAKLHRTTALHPHGRPAVRVEFMRRARWKCAPFEFVSSEAFLLFTD
jgi:hypothetical protein